MRLCKVQTHQGLEGMQHVIAKLNSDLLDIFRYILNVQTDWIMLSPASAKDTWYLEGANSEKRS